MPLQPLSEARTVGPVLQIDRDVPPVQRPGFFDELLPAAFEQENVVGTLLGRVEDSGEREHAAFEKVFLRDTVNDFDPFAHIRGYEDFADAFVEANSLRDVERVKRRIDREIENRRILSEGGGLGLLASITAAFLDPINLVPIGGAAIKARGAGSILKAGLRTAGVGATAAALQEIPLGALQETRTKEEIAVNITGAAFLSSILGGAVHALAPRELADLGRQVEKDLTLDDIPPARPQPARAVEPEAPVRPPEEAVETAQPLPPTEAPEAEAPAAPQTREPIEAAADLTETAAEETLSEEVDVNPAPAIEAATVAARPFDESVGAFLDVDNLRDINIDAARFQFKSETDAAGVTERLQGTREWDNTKTGMAVVWQDNEGRLFIADGHQRAAFAKRLIENGVEDDVRGEPLRLPAIILREADGYTAADARLIAAEKNIAEGSGTAIDAAKIVREGARLDTLPPKSALVRQAKGLAKLGDSAFQRAINSNVPARYLALVGDLVDDVRSQEGVIGALEAFAGDIANEAQARSIIEDAADLIVVRETEDLFGEGGLFTEGESLLPLRARIKDAATKRLKSELVAFGNALRNKGRLEGRGSRIDAAQAREALGESGTALELMNVLTRFKGPISDKLNQLARDVDGGKPLGKAVSEFVEEVKRHDPADLTAQAEELAPPARDVAPRPPAEGRSAPAAERPAQPAGGLQDLAERLAAQADPGTAAAIRRAAGEMAEEQAPDLFREGPAPPRLPEARAEGPELPDPGPPEDLLPFDDLETALPKLAPVQDHRLETLLQELGNEERVLDAMEARLAADPDNKRFRQLVHVQRQRVENADRLVEKRIAELREGAQPELRPTRPTGPRGTGRKAQAVEEIREPELPLEDQVTDTSKLGDVKRALGRAEKLGLIFPDMQLAVSDSAAAREAVHHLAGLSVLTEGNGFGVAAPVSVQQLSKLHQSRFFAGVLELRRQFAALRTGDPRSSTLKLRALDRIFPGRRGDAPTWDEFKRAVYYALDNGDVDALGRQEVSDAARFLRENVYEPLKERAIAAGLLPKDVRVSTAISYVNRLWNPRAIAAHRPELRAKIETYLASIADDLIDAGVVTADEIEGFIAQESERLIDRIMHAPLGRVPYDITVGPRGPLRARTFNIPDRLINGADGGVAFVERDVERLIASYVRTMSVDVELAARFGDVELTRYLGVNGEGGKIREGYQAIINRTADPAERTRLDGAMKKDLQNVAMLRDVLRGTYAMPADPHAVGPRILRAGRVVTLLSRLGNVTVNSVIDIARPVMIFGLRDSFRDGLLPLVRNARAFLRAADLEVKQAAAVGWEMVRDARMLSVSDITDEFAQGTPVERAIGAAANTFGMVSLQSPWNAAIRQFVGVQWHNRVLRLAEEFAATGLLSDGDRELLALFNIGSAEGDNMLARIADQFRRFGETDGGVRIANTAKWTDGEAARALAAGTNKLADTVIVLPGIGDRPKFVQDALGIGSRDLGLTVFQFKSFSLAATQKIAILGLQRRDAAFLNGMLLSTTLGMMVYGAKEALAGRELPDDPAVWLGNGIDLSGSLGYLADVNLMAERMVGVGVSSLTGTPTRHRFGFGDPVSTIGGPTAGLINDAFRTGGAALRGDFTQSNARALRRMLPYQNLFYVRWLFDQLERATTDALGVPQSGGATRARRAA